MVSVAFPSREQSSATPGQQVRVLVAHAMSEAGDGITAVALPLLIFTSTGSISKTSLVLVFGMLPSVLFGLWAGTVADKFDRRLLVVVGDVLRALALFSIPVVHGSAGAFGVAGVAFFARTVGTFQQPASEAALPSFMGEAYQRFLGRRSGLLFLSQGLGPVLGGALVGLLGAVNAILVDGASFLLASFLIATIRDFDRTSKQRRATSTSSMWRQIREGLAYARNNVIVTGLLFYWCASSLAVPIALLAAIPYLLDDLGVTSLLYGLAVSCFAGASIAGSLIAGRISRPGGRRKWLLASGLGYGLINLTMLAEPSYLIFCVLWFIWGISYGPEEVLTQLIFAESMPEQLRGRMYGLAGIALGCAGTLGYALSGPIISMIGAAQAMAVAGGLFILATVGSFGVGPLSRELRQKGAPLCM